ncbi:MAG: hypothetical protein LBJ67_10315 [Planctomycetaceae bacterium]|nr:hypothetical protein [Planctomycetaceae bacterium]
MRFFKKVAARSVFLNLLIFAAFFVLILFIGCQFPYKIDPSGNRLFVRNEETSLPENKSMFIAPPGTPRDYSGTAIATSTASETPAAVPITTLPGIVASPGTSSGNSNVVSNSNLPYGGLVRGASPNTSTPLLTTGSGPIVLTSPVEQIALVGSEVLCFASYKGDDDYLRTGKQIEWSLGGVGHILTMNKTEYGNCLTFDFTKAKKVSDRYAVTSTLHSEGVVDRGDAFEPAPHLAGQSWVSIQSAEEGTSTVTAYAPDIKDATRRSSNAVIHWVDAEWIYPNSDVTKYDEPKIFVTKIKKRTSGAPCPKWIARYEIIGGPQAGFGESRAKVVDVIANENGEAAADLHLLEGDSGVSTVSVKIIRPVGVDSGTKRLELHSANVQNIWAKDAPLTIQAVLPSAIRWNEQFTCQINVTNHSSVSKPGTVTLILPEYLKLISSAPQTTAQTPQSDGGSLLTWQNLDVRGEQTMQISLVLQAMTNNTTLSSQPLNIELNPQLSMYVGDSTNDVSNGADAASSVITSPSTMPTTPYSPSPLTPLDSSSELTPSGFGGIDAGTMSGGTTAETQQPSNDPLLFRNKLVVDCQVPALLHSNTPTSFDVMVTNNATVPFGGGQVRVTLPDGLGFTKVDDSGKREYIRDSTNGLLKTREFLIVDDVGSDSSIYPNTTTKIPLDLAATINSGSVTITVEVFGYDPRKLQRDIISSKSKSVKVFPAPGN